MNATALGILCLLGLVSAPSQAGAGDGHVTTRLPAHHAADPDAPVVTDRNLLASDRFWPYRVALVRPWQPGSGGAPLPSGIAGVLIRVEASGIARIDFGRDGVHRVPVAETDLLARANHVRLGEVEKPAPNFLFDIGPRLLDAASKALRPASYEAAAEHRVFLCVFADSGAKGFAELARALAPSSIREGLSTILFPQGMRSDAQVHERLRSLDFAVPFVYGHLSVAYTHSLLAENTPPPALLVVTREGRVLFQSRWRTGAVPELISALDDALGR